MIKMYLKIQDIFTRPNEFLSDMSGGQTEFHEDCTFVVHLTNTYHAGLLLKFCESINIAIGTQVVCNGSVSETETGKKINNFMSTIKLGNAIIIRIV